MCGVNRALLEWAWYIELKASWTDFLCCSIPVCIAIFLLYVSVVILSHTTDLSCAALLSLCQLLNISDLQRTPSLGSSSCSGDDFFR